MIKNFLLYLVVFFALALSVLAEPETVDKIAIVVGNDVILASEVASQIQLVAFQMGQQPKSQTEVEQLQQEVMAKMVSDKLFLIEAKKDTTISIRRDEIKQALNDHIARISAAYSTEEEFLQALTLEGMTLRDLERRYEKDIENNLLRQRYIQQKLYNVSVSRFEVDRFYNDFSDSIPNQPEAVRLSHILLKISPGKELEDSIREVTVELRQRVLDGADFATISSQNSSLGAGANGGDLGYISRDDVVPEFARAAFKLSPGDISGVVRTQFGFHIIKCEGKRGDKLRLRHILLAVQPNASDTTRILNLADSLVSELNSDASFEELAKLFSTDDETRPQGGELGWFAMEQLPGEFEEAIAGWTTTGEIRGPVLSSFGVHILKLLEYQPEKELTLDNDFDKIKELARQDKTGKLVDDWIEEIKERTFIEYRLEDSSYAN